MENEESAVRQPACSEACASEFATLVAAVFEFCSEVRTVSHKCIATSNKKLLETSASLLVTRSY